MRPGADGKGRLYCAGGIGLQDTEMGVSEKGSKDPWSMEFSIVR